MKKMDAVLASLSRLLAVVGGAMLVVIMLALVIDVVSKAVRQSPIEGLVSYLQIALVAMVFLAMPFAQRLDAHVSMGLLVEAVPPRLAHGIQALGLAVVVPVMGYVAYNTVLLALDSISRREATLDIVNVPVWPARMILSLGLLVLVLELTRSVLSHAGQAAAKHSVQQEDVVVEPTVRNSKAAG